MKAWMKGMSRFVSLTMAFGLAAPLLLAMPDRAAAVDNYEVVEDFPGPSPSGWTSSSGITSMSASSVAYEGAYSLALDYALDASTTTASVSKTLPGVDASVYNGVQFRLKGPDVVGSYTFKVTTATGTWQTAPMQFGSFDFARIFLPWSGFRKSGDLSVVATAADMASVSQLTFQIGRRFGETAPSVSGTLYLDDIRWAEDRVDDFESGISGWTADAYSTLSQSAGAGEAFEGASALRIDTDFAGQPAGSVSTATYGFATEADASEWNGLSLLVKGDGSGQRFSAGLHTGAGATFVTKPFALDFEGWRRIPIYWGQFYQGAYVSPTAADLADIDQVSFSIERAGAASASTVYVDSVLFTDTHDLFANLDLSQPAMSAVQADIAVKDYESAKADLLAYMQARTSPSYFYNWSDRTSIMNAFNSQYPNAIDAIVASAGLAKNSDFTFEGDHRQLDPDGDGDIVWQQGNNVFTQYLARTGWWLDLGKAYWNSALGIADESYAAAFVASLRDFYRDAPMPHTILFSTFSNSDLASFYVPGGNLWGGLDTGIRMDNWVGAYAFFVQSPTFTAEDNYLFLQSLLDQAEYLYGYEGAYRPGNMQIIECYGLYAASVMFPEFAHAADWNARAKAFLQEQLDDGVLSDGFFKELTFGYHEWMIETFFRMKSLGDIGGDPFSPAMDAKLEKMFEVDMKMMDPKGNTPPISDSQPFNRRSLLSLGAALYSRGDFKYLSDNKINSAYFWSLSSATQANLANMTSTVPSFTSVRLDDAKYYAMRTGWNDGHYFVFDAAPYLAGHYHRDQLNIIAESNGEPMIVDPGKGNYSDWENYPSYFVYNAHNTVFMDNYVNSQYPTPVEKAWETDASHDFAAASVDYSSLDTPIAANRAPFAAERNVYFAKPNYWIMNDLLTPTDPAVSHTYSQQFHFSPSAISVNATTKAIEVNDTIDNFEVNSLSAYTKSAYTTIANVDTEKYEGQRGLKVDYNLALGSNWFRKNAPYNATAVSGISVWIKGNASADAIKPYLLTSSGNWIYGQTLSLNYTGWKQFTLPWRTFAKETDSTIAMGPGQATGITSVDFHFQGTGAGTVYFDDIRFYDFYDIDNFESQRIANFEDGSLSGWTGRLSSPAIDTTSSYSGAKSLKYTLSFPAGGTSSDFDYIRKTQSYDASKTGGAVLAVKGTGTPINFTFYLSTTNGTATNVWRLKQSYTMNYSGWRLYYLPWSSFVNASNTSLALTSADVKQVNFVETRFIRSSSTALNPVVQIDELGFFDYYQEKDTFDVGLDTWSAADSAMTLSLDSANKFEGANALKLSFSMGAGATKSAALKTGSYIATNGLYAGVSLRVKGNGDANNKLRLLLNGYISPAISLASTGWNTVYFPWSDFTLEANPAIVMGEPQVKSLELRVERNGGSATGTIDVDNIGFVGSIHNNMTIVPADPGAVASVDAYTGWVYYNAGRYEKAPYIKIVKTATGNAFYDTILYPGAKGMSPKVTVTRLGVSENGTTLSPTQASGLQMTITDGGHTYTDTYLISHDGSGTTRQFGSYSYNGAKAYIRSENGVVTQTVTDPGATLTP
ncbi:heparinase II/III family protein [Cohnella hashimotonis]|uniref:Heparinase II/III family protein n=1 Tax=Cohnella hashimotonis TaxID=2826895 RepID=A0ABT6TIX4_9BACL|nr:heparinase II/III family protein [Cohnella hashimotonis]MDI4646798.1 heparinase II/III family protein [Cohnella hashimotonis]